jgi:hypothetical protein
MGDLSGYTLTFTAQEQVPANFIDNTFAVAAGVNSFGCANQSLTGVLNEERGLMPPFFLE